MSFPPIAYLVRHGQTEWNLIGRRQGQLDSPLTNAGRSSAADVARRLVSSDIDCIYSSPLGRALETAEIIAASMDAEVVILSDLAEVHHGDMAGMNDEQITARYPREWAARQASRYEWRFPGGESYTDAHARAITALNAITSDRPLVVSHEMIGRMLRGTLLGLSPEEALKLNHPHRAIFRVANREASQL